MKKFLSLIGVVFVTTLSPGQTNKLVTVNQDEPPKTEQELRAIEHKWAEAVKHRDVDTIQRIQADEFEFTGPAGEIWTKTRALDFIKVGNLEIASFELSEFKVRLYGDTAVVNFRAVWDGTANGNDISGPQRMTDVFVKRDGRWQCVSSQTTRILQ